MSPNLKRRLGAGLIHLLLSIGVASLAALLIFCVWYPGALAPLQGVNRLLLLMIVVDVCLGPLLTMVVFSPGKTLRLLRLDLGLIGLLQLSALVYGVSVIAQGRPAYLVFELDRFVLVSAADVATEGLAAARQRPGVGGPSWFGPRLVSARLPEDPALRQDILMAAVNGGADLAQRPQWYAPYTEDRAIVLRKLRPLEQLQKANGLDEGQLQERMKGEGVDPARAAYLPLRVGPRDGVIFVDRQSAEVLGYATLLPLWSAAMRQDSPAEAPAVGGPGYPESIIGLPH
ncbi:MAG TPA: TfpX/TfpZ family type IV pilin accessory protein [Solimonas sp.]